MRPFLPKYNSSYHDERSVAGVKKHYKLLGIKILKEYDELFYKVEFPEGWTSKEENYWTYIYNDEGKEVMNYFLKRTWYEYDAFVHFTDVA